MSRGKKVAQTAYERGDKFIRVLKLLDHLMLTKGGMSAHELADALATNVRSVQRYIKQLEAAGLDIERDDANRYRVGARSRLPTLQFTGAEGVAVLVALRLLQKMFETPDAAVTGAVGRLARAMNMPAVTAYLGTMVQDGAASRSLTPEERVRGVVVECFLSRIPCEIQYENAAGEISKRVIRTYFLEPRPESRTLYAYALDDKRRAMVWFRLDRIQAARAVKILGTYQVPVDFDIDEVVSSSWGIWQAGDELQEVVLRFAPSAGARVKLSQWHRGAQLTDLPGGGVQLRIWVASEIEMRPWVLGWGSQVEVIAPPALRTHVATAMREGAHLYDDHPSQT